MGRLSVMLQQHWPAEFPFQDHLTGPFQDHYSSDRQLQVQGIKSSLLQCFHPLCSSCPQKPSYCAQMLTVCQAERQAMGLNRSVSKKELLWKLQLQQQQSKSVALELMWEVPQWLESRQPHFVSCSVQNVVLPLKIVADLDNTGIPDTWTHFQFHWVGLASLW